MGANGVCQGNLLVCTFILPHPTITDIIVVVRFTITLFGHLRAHDVQERCSFRRSAFSVNRVNMLRQ